MSAYRTVLPGITIMRPFPKLTIKVAPLALLLYLYQYNSRIICENLKFYLKPGHIGVPQTLFRIRSQKPVTILVAWGVWSWPSLGGIVIPYCPRPPCRATSQNKTDREKNITNFEFDWRCHKNWQEEKKKNDQIFFFSPQAPKFFGTALRMETHF